ncbi:MAG: hypothetical protein E7597_00660 [Ruminococcaceae bacterium]|nr:hypothetical protein [Oscillospiraceae bacterium]
MRISQITETIKRGGYDTAFKALYADAGNGRKRAVALCEDFAERFGDLEDAALFSAPGRMEIIGNHTDHNGGQAVGAAIDRDILAIAAPVDGIVNIYEGEVLTEAKLDEAAEKGSSAALAAGMARRFGGGFCACTDSRIPIGKGLSSSAAFALLCGKIADSFYGNGATEMELALAAKLTENEDFGKKCGLLDQISCAFGGTVHIDFSSPIPTVSPVAYNVGDMGIFLVDTGVSHAGADSKYGQIAEDMECAAAYFGASRLGEVSTELFAEKKERMRLKLGDRVYRRALHFFDENKRVSFFCRRAALGQLPVCLYAVNGSGISSRTNLCNVHTEANEATEALKDIAAAIRIHGGGFGGSIQCYVPKEKTAQFTEKMEELFGKGCVIPANIRAAGVCKLDHE